MKILNKIEKQEMKKQNQRNKSAHIYRGQEIIKGLADQQKNIQHNRNNLMFGNQAIVK